VKKCDSDIESQGFYSALADCACCLIWRWSAICYFTVKNSPITFTLEDDRCNDNDAEGFLLVRYWLLEIIRFPSSLSFLDCGSQRVIYNVCWIWSSAEIFSAPESKILHQIQFGPQLKSGPSS